MSSLKSIDVCCVTARDTRLIAYRRAGARGRPFATASPGWAVFLGLMLIAGTCVQRTRASSLQDDLRPKFITAETVAAVKKGLDYLAGTQSPDGSWQSADDGSTYPLTMTALAGMAFLANGNTPSRGPYADSVRKAMQFLMKHSSASGLLISSSRGGNGRPMYGHGFSLLFLCCVYGMETDTANRDRLAAIIRNAITLTSRAQSPIGGWTYTPGGGDEGSVTVTQMQGLRAAHNAGFTVPPATIEKAIRYLEVCRTPEGGIRYSYGSSASPKLAISAAAIACLYSAGDYDSDMAQDCLRYVFKVLNEKQGLSRRGHSFYTLMYGAQAIYQAGDEYWDEFFPKTRDWLIEGQKEDGSWQGSVGSTFSSGVALISLQLPYKFLPIYQR